MKRFFFTFSIVAVRVTCKLLLHFRKKERLHSCCSFSTNEHSLETGKLRKAMLGVRVGRHVWGAKGVASCLGR